MSVAKKYHGRQWIIDKFKEAGIISDDKKGLDNFVYWTNVKRNLVLPRRAPGTRWSRVIVTDDEMFQIIHEFLPGGDGWWEPGKARFLPDGTLKPEEETPVDIEIVQLDNPVEEPKYGYSI